MKKYRILGVSMGWEERKGLDVFLKLCEILDDTFEIVLVGTDQRVDEMLPERIISIHRTKDQYELSKLYTEADLLVNPSREDNYPTVNIEANSCGTAVIGFEIGGVAETIFDGMGQVVPLNNIEAMVEAIHKWINIEIPIETLENCRYQNSNYRMIEEYKELYSHILEK